MLLDLLSFSATFLLSLALAIYVTPLVREGAIRYGVLDHPDGNLKTHAEPIPYLGGVAVYLAFLVTMSVIFQLDGDVLGLLLGGTMLAMIGLFDDLRVLTPGLKLAGQLLAAWVMLRSGIFIKLTVVPIWLAVPVSVLWLIGITNAFNILDVSDGLASGVAAIAGVGLFIIAVLAGNMVIAVTTLALVGSLIGFLHFNQPPARIFLGDTGSLFVGFLLAALSMIGQYTHNHNIGALAPLCILCVPILDTTLVTCARLRRGIAPWHGSPDHFAIRLKHRGWSARRVAFFSYGLGCLGATAGVGMVISNLHVATTIMGAAAVLFLGLLVWLGLQKQPHTLTERAVKTLDGASLTGS